MKKYILLILILSFGKLYSQTVLLQEDFESVSRPVGWTEIKVKGNSYNGEIVPWVYAKGGYGSCPDTAAKGNKNARFYIPSDNGEATKLVTKKLSLLGKTKPKLEFYIVQQPLAFDSVTIDWDILKVYYRAGSDPNWYLLKEYLQYIEQWQKDSILLPDSILLDNFYLAFEGTSGNGVGTCIDDVRIFETGVSTASVLYSKLVQPYTDFIPAGTAFNPIARLDIYIGEIKVA